MAAPDLSPLDDLYQDVKDNWWYYDKWGLRHYDNSAITAIRAVYEARKVVLPDSFKKYWCEYCNTSGEIYFILDHQKVHREGKKRCPDCHITLPYHHKMHAANFCAASASSPKLAGRFWNPDTLSFHYQSTKIYSLLVVKADQHVRAVVDQMRLQQKLGRLERRYQESIPLGLAASYKAQIELVKKELADLISSSGFSASLEKLPAPLTSRQRFVYGSTRALL
ncbi:hypothetical protein JCM3765_004745 [Sporobolomyces pararoseus]